MQKKQTRLYNVIFPVWMLLLFPITWAVVLPANFLMDSIVVLAALKLFGETDIFKTYKSVILRVWLLGFVSDIIGCALLFTSQIGYSRTWYEYIQGPVAYNPLDNIFALLFVLVAVAATGVFIYFFNMRHAFNKTQLDKSKRHAIALALAVITAPYILIVPLDVLSNGPGALDRSEIFTHHIVPNGYNSMTITPSEDEVPLDWGQEEKEFYYSTYQLGKSINTSDRMWKKEVVPQRDADYRIEFYDATEEPQKPVRTVGIWIEGEEIYYQYKDRFYRAQSGTVGEIKNIINGIETGEIIGDKEITQKGVTAAEEA